MFLVLMPLDFRDPVPEKALSRVAEIASECRLVGVSLSSNYMRTAIKITEGIKKINPDLPVMWGGIHPTLKPLECLDYCDMSAAGEAEEAVCELANRIQNGEPYYDTLNFHFKTPEGKIISNPVRPLQQNLDSIPFPDYFKQDHYILKDDRLVPVTDELLNENLQGQYLTLSTRGCVHSCAFCCNDFLKQLYAGDKRFRKRSIENVIEECEQAKENLPWITEILFDDDAFMARSLKNLKKFGRLWKERVNIPFFVTGITPAGLTEDKLEVLLDAGLRRIRVGIQTASDRVNYDIYNRRISREKAEKSLEIIERHKERLARHHYDFIIENPWETSEENLETLRFLLKIPRPWAINICSLTFYPGTALHERAVKEGIISDDFEEVYDKSYKVYKPTYINRLFYLFCQSDLPVWVLSLFVNKWIIKLRLNYPLWWGYVALRDTKRYLRNLKMKFIKPGQHQHPSVKDHSKGEKGERP